MAAVDLNNLKRGGTTLVVGTAAQALVAFAVNLVLVRTIVPEEFGRFAVVLAGASVVYWVMSLRVNVLIIRLGDADYDERAKGLYFSAITLEALAATLIILLWLAATGGLGLWETVLVAAVGLRHWTDLNKTFYERAMHYRQLAYVETGAALGGHMTALALTLLGAGWVVLFIREAVISVLNVWGLAAVGGLTLRPLTMLSVADWRQLFKEARKVWLDSVLEGSFQRWTILLAGFLGGDAAAGLFFQAQRLAVVPQQFLAPVVNRIMANWFGRTEDPAERIRGRDRLLRTIAVPLAAAGVLTVLFADPVVPWLFGDNWAGAADLFAAMCGMVAFFSLFETLKSYCLTTRQSGKLLAGRAVQYAGLLAPAAAGYLGWLNAEVSLAIGLSAAYVLAFLFVLLVLRRDERGATTDGMGGMGGMGGRR